MSAAHKAAPSWRCRASLIAPAIVLLGVLATVAGGAAPPLAPPEQLEIVLDTSSSFGLPYRRESLAEIAAAVTGWPRSLPALGGSASRPGLTVRLRGVSGVSYSPEDVLGTWRIPSVPAVVPLPTKVTANLTVLLLAYKNQVAAAKKAERQVELKAHRAAKALEHLQPPTTYASEIEGAVSAAAQSFAAAGARRLLIVSDLAQNRHPQIAGSLRNVQVLVMHLCTEAAVCARQERSWRNRLEARGASQLEFVRIEQFPSALKAFLGET